MVPAVVSLLLWMIVPLGMTIYFSFIRYNLLNSTNSGFAFFENYAFLAGDPSFWPAIINTLIFIGSVLLITVVFGVMLAVLYDQELFGRNVAMLLVIAPFFVMPTVSALIWKNMIMHPVYGLISLVCQKPGLPIVDWFAQYPLFSVIPIVSWEWIPFSFLILVTFVFRLSHSGRVQDSLLPDEKDAVNAALDALHQNDASGRRTHPYLHPLAVSWAVGLYPGADHHFHVNQSSDRRLDELHLFLRGA